MELVVSASTGAMNALHPKLAKMKEGIKYLHKELEKVSEVSADRVDRQVKLWARDIRELHKGVKEGIPELAGLVRIGPWGGNRGRPHDIKVPPCRLKSVTIGSDMVVDSIAFLYSDCNGQQHTAGPWGGYLGSNYTIHFGPTEFLTKVSGTIGRFLEDPAVVTSLTLVTNAHSYGPFGRGGGTPFNTPMLSNCAIVVGFFGRAGRFVDAIGVYVKPEQETVKEEEAEPGKIGLWSANTGTLRDIDRNGPWGGHGRYAGSDQTVRTARDVRLELLEKITGGFSEEHKIGSGGYGKVYKGVLNGKEIAVKKLHSNQALDDVIFKNESENLMRVRHPNIVELVGYCHEIRHRYVEHKGKTVWAEMVDRALCFEYSQNGSLEKRLYEEHSGFDWCTRYKIIKGICEGLNYLHHGLEESILHLDLKPANILLDENMVPKIADFGLSRLFGGTHTHITKNPVGTEMYMPPEYVKNCIITKKYDVFSLGVIIIQIMTGRNGYSECREMSPQQFIELVHQNWKVRVEATSMHTSAGEDCKQVKKCIEIALNCVETEREKRPTIGDIIHKLRETETMIHEAPITFSRGGQGRKQEAAFSKIGPWGESVGRAHSMKVAPHRLESVTIWSDVIVDAFSFSYSDHNGKKHTIGPWGGSGGGVDRIKFAPSEFLLEVSGTFGPSSWAVADVVQSLTLVTNTASYGPFGQAGGGTPFHTSIQSNGRIVGFFGHGGMFVHAIGVYVRHFEREIGNEDEEALAKIGPLGGNGGMAYDMKVTPHRLESLTIFSDVVVNSLSFSYDDLNGNQHTAGPWGGPGGNPYTIPLGRFGFLTKVSGTIGSFGTIPNVITSLMFTTNWGESYGPLGQGGGTPFHILVENNGRIVGLFGRGGMFVHAIGVYVRHFEREMVQGGKEVIFGQETVQGEIGNEDEEY